MSCDIPKCFLYINILGISHDIPCLEGCHGRDHMVVGFTTTCAISTYHHWHCEFEPRLWRVVLDTTLCDKVYQWLVTGPWFSPGTQVSSISKTDRHDITEISFNIINQNQTKPIPCLKPEYNFTYPFMTTIPVDSLSLQVSTLPWVQWHSWNTANVGVKHQSLTFIVSYLLRLLNVWCWLIAMMLSFPYPK
jgi:hypothetical protein